MIPFRTEIPATTCPDTINHTHKILIIGSCFAEQIGLKLTEYKFQARINPFGVLYNPASIKKGIEILLNQAYLTDSDLFYNNGMWNSFHHHSNFSHSDKAVCLVKINKSIESASNFLRTAEFLILTFGTSWIYTLSQSNAIVANCHKLSGKMFSRSRITVNSIVNDYIQLFNLLKKTNPGIKFIFTVSPIRHWKDGAIENSISKATLFLSIDEIIQYCRANSWSASYFPSYEFMIDDLRDYRFYKEDMLHPDKIAVDYIWDKFCQTYFTNTTQNLLDEFKDILNAKNHKSFNPQSENHKHFLARFYQKVVELEKRFPYLDFKEELDYFLDIHN